VNVIVQDESSEQAVESALKHGPYGRCVYECDNDVCDNQIVNLQFKNGSTASFTMIATTEMICTRQTKVYGSKAELTADASGCGKIILFDFLRNKRHVIHTESDTTPGRKIYSSSSLKGHGYADYFIMDSFIRAVQEQNPGLISTNAAESLKTHEIVFKAEQLRINAATLSSW
jgi:predicted dehydrogenase